MTHRQFQNNPLVVPPSLSDIDSIHALHVGPTQSSLSALEPTPIVWRENLGLRGLKELHVSFVTNG